MPERIETTACTCVCRDVAKLMERGRERGREALGHATSLLAAVAGARLSPVELARVAVKEVA